MASAARRALAWVVLATFAATFGFGAALPSHLSGDDDPACNPGTATGHNSSQFETVKASTSAAHCPFCHWQRVVGGAYLSSGVTGDTQLQSADAALPVSFDRASSIFPDDQSSRGPPPERL
jgi:hypothetical protein